MATATLAPPPYQTVLDTDGVSVPGALVYTYLAGTTTPVDTWTTSAATVANANPIVADAAGRFVAYLLPGVAYKFLYKTAAGSTIRSDDLIAATPAASGDLNIAGTAGEALVAGDSVYLSDGSGGLTAGRWYKADADLLYASSGAGIVGMVPESIASGASGSFRIVGRITGLSGLTVGSSYYISATAGGITATAPAYARFLGVADGTTSIVLGANPARPETIVDVGRCDGRLTLTTAVPVTTADVTAATSVYFTPYKGNRVALYDGAVWALYSFTEKTLSLAGLAADKPHDVFLYNNAGTLTLEALVWTNLTTRATALVLQDGVWVKTGATTRRYLGTFCTTATIGQTEDSAAKRLLWNYYHRVVTPVSVLEATDSWTYTTATWRQANGAAGNQIAIVQGVAECPIAVMAHAVSGQANSDVNRSVGIGEDSTTAPVSGSIIGLMSTAPEETGVARLTKVPAVGYHSYAWLEYSVAAGTTTWMGDGGADLVQTGLTGTWYR